MPDKKEILLNKDSKIILHLKENNKTMPDGSRIILASDQKEKLVVSCQKSEYSKPKMYDLNYKTGDIFVDGKEGTAADIKEMRKLITYFKTNAKDSDSEIFLIPDKGKGVD